jgi:uncharacterized Zn finger protein (UPF0148 family)
MATTQCPACHLTVPYFCCEGLVCPACGYDEEKGSRDGQEASEQATPAHSPSQPSISQSPSA